MGSLYEEMMTNQLKKEKVPVFIKQLSKEYLPEIEEIQQAVWNGMPDKSFLQPLTREEFDFLFAGNGLVIGAWSEDRLIGFRALLAPAIDEEHLGRDIGLPEGELASVIYQEISVVLPAYRGNRLQQKMAKAAMEQLPEMDRSFRYVCCTVAPMNVPSLKDKFSQGMEIRALKEKYEGLLRYIFVKDMERQVSYGESVPAQMADLELQKTLLSKGFVGTGLREKDGRYTLQFEKLVCAE